MRLLYAAGAGDVLGTFSDWRRGRDDPRQLVCTYSGQFFDVVAETGARALVITRYGEPRVESDGTVTIRQRPNSLERSGGALYHLGQLLYGLRLLADVIRFRPHVAIVCEGMTHWFLLSPMRLLGTQIVPSCHSAFWPLSGRRRGVRRLLERLSRRLFSRDALAILVASGRIAEQVSELAGGDPRPVSEFLPLYRRELFEGIVATDPATAPMHVLFIGRLEVDKGALDIVEIARRLRERGRDDLVIDVCGDGSVREELARRVESLDLGASVLLHGHCEQDVMRGMLERCFCVIAPSRSTLVEGFNQVLSDAVLAGRPVISSDACPAIEYVLPAAVRVPPDDVDAYADAIVGLVDDPTAYEERRRACATVSAAFYDASRSWGAAVRRVIDGVR